MFYIYLSIIYLIINKNSSKNKNRIKAIMLKVYKRNKSIYQKKKSKL